MEVLQRDGGAVRGRLRRALRGGRCRCWSGMQGFPTNSFATAFFKAVISWVKNITLFSSPTIIGRVHGFPTNNFLQVVLYFCLT